MFYDEKTLQYATVLIRRTVVDTALYTEFSWLLLYMRRSDITELRTNQRRHVGGIGPTTV